MTFEETFRELLAVNGMLGFDDEIDKVMEILKNDESLQTLRGRWNDDVGGYPKGMLYTLWATARYVVVRYIDENTPRAWYRAVFAADLPALEG